MSDTQTVQTSETSTEVKPKRTRRSAEEMAKHYLEKAERSQNAAKQREMRDAVLDTPIGERVQIAARAANGLIRFGKAENHAEAVRVGENLIADLAPLAVSLGLTLPSWEEKRGRPIGSKNAAPAS